MNFNLRQSARHASFWFSTLNMNGAKSRVCVMDDFGNLVKVCDATFASLRP